MTVLAPTVAKGEIMQFNERREGDSQVQSSPQAKAPPTMKFTYATGDRPLDGYSIKRGIGCGGFGEVYYATSDGGKEVALKLVRRHLDVELRGVNQCLNLKHVNLVVLYDVKREPDGDCWVVMEYMAGESLDEVIARNPQGLPQDEVLRYLRGICQGVGYLHAHGIVHRDLKPGNIFTEHGLVKLGDYGLAKFISASRRSGQTESIGTVHYMAPELSQGRYGKEIDLYALGVILYEMLVGRVPFEGESAGEILMKHLTSQPDLTRVPAAFRVVVGRLLAKDPLERYESVDAMLADLDHRLAGGADVSAPADRGVFAQAAGLAAVARRPIADAIRRALQVAGRILIALLLAVGAGLTAGAVGTAGMDEELAVLLGVAIGFITAGALVIVLCRRPAGPHRWWPGLAALLLGAGVGCLSAVVPAAVRLDEIAVVVGLACGTLSAALIGFFLYTSLGVPLRWRWLFVMLLVAVGTGLSVAALGMAAGIREERVVMAAIGSGCLALGTLACLLHFGRLAERLDPAQRRSGKTNGTGGSGGFLGRTRVWSRVWRKGAGAANGLPPFRRTTALAGVGLLCAVVGVLAAGAGGALLLSGSDMSAPPAMGILYPSTQVIEWEMNRLAGHQGKVNAIAFHPEAKWLASSGADGTVRIWDLATSTELAQLPGDSIVASIAVSPKGDRLATNGYGRARVWDVATRQQVCETPELPGMMHAVAFNDDGSRFAAAGYDDVVRMFDSTTGAQVRQFFGCAPDIHALAFSVDGSQLAAGSRQEYRACIWDTSAPSAPRVLHTSATVHRLALSRQGFVALGSEQGPLRLFDLATGDPGRQFADATIDFEFSPDGRQLAVATWNGLMLWDVERGFNLCQFKNERHQFACVAFHPDGSHLASGGHDGTIRIWEIPENLRTVKPPDLPSRDVQLDPPAPLPAVEAEDAQPSAETETAPVDAETTGDGLPPTEDSSPEAIPPPSNE